MALARSARVPPLKPLVDQHLDTPAEKQRGPRGKDQRGAGGQQACPVGQQETQYSQQR